MPGHLSPKPTVSALLALGPRRGSLGPESLDSLQRERQEDLQLPSTLETFEAARELIEDTALPPLSLCDWDQDLALKRPTVPSKGSLPCWQDHGLPSAAHQQRLVLRPHGL